MSFKTRQTAEALPSLALPRRIERAIRDIGLELAQDQRSAEGGVAAFHAIGSRFNRIYGLALEEQCHDGALRELLAFMEERGEPNPPVETSPAADRSADTALRRAGFEVVERLETLVLPLDGYGLQGTTPASSEVSVEDVDAGDPSALGAFAELMHGGFSPDEPLLERTRADMQHAARCTGVELVGARLDGAWAGGGQVATRDGLSVLYGASVLPAFRCRGVQQALIAARIRRARERGSTLMAVFCDRSSATYRNALRNGFQPAYLRLQWKRPRG